MSALVVAFGGGISSGKSSLSKRVAESLGCARVSFGDYVRTVARDRQLADSREALQELGASLIADGWEKFCRGVLGQVRWSPAEPLVIDGVRHAEALNTIKKLVAPAKVVFVFVDLSVRDQEQRMRQGGLTDPEKRRRVLQHATEGQIRSALPSLADLTVDGGQPLETATSKVIDWVRRLSDLRG